MAPPRGKPQIKLNATMFVLLLEELVSGPCSAQHLADHTGLGVVTVQRVLRHMRAKHLARIAAWEKDANGRYQIRIFAFGEGRDAKRPPPKKKNDSLREWRARVRQRSMDAVLSGASA